MSKPNRASKDELRDALSIAVSMLKIVQQGGTLSTDAWFERMDKIERVRRKDELK